MKTISDTRSRDDLKQHYEVEKELAERLRNASKDERLGLYSKVYDELFRRVPHHSQLRKKASPELEAARVSRRMRLLLPFLNRDSVFMEIGAGSGALSLRIAPSVNRVYALDVSKEIATAQELPPNMQYLISDGCSVPVPEGSVDLAFSDQLIEHLHPDDAFEQLENIHAALRPGGICICMTPNRLNGPHDVSKYFSDVAEGFHLKEYTNGELKGLFREAGFARVRVLIGARGRYIGTPVLPVASVERIISRLPRRAGKSIADTSLLRVILGCRIFSEK